MLIIDKRASQYWVKVRLKALMIALVQQKKANTKFRLSVHYNSDESYLFVNKTWICKFNAKGNISQCNFCLESVSQNFTKDEQSEMLLNDTVYDFSVDHNSVQKEDIINIHQYLMIKNNIK